MSTPTVDALSQAVEVGSLASRLLGPLQKEVDHREEVVLSRLLVSYRNKTLTGKEAMLAVAELAGLRSLLSDLDSRARQGQAAEKSLYPSH